ncbi:MAG: methionine synthase [Mycobacteriales bacterium]
MSGIPAGIATGIGSLPGTDPVESARLVLDEVPDLPYLAELPARGPGADIIGRSAAVLVHLPVEIGAWGWRFADAAGRDLRRARDFLDRDLDALTDAADGYAGPLKLQVAGPWTLAAGIELRRGERALRDLGACRDLTQSLATGIAEHVAEVRRRVPTADVIVQIDEPSLPLVLAGRVETASRLSTIPAIEETTAEDALRVVFAATGTPCIAHCCAPGVPLALLHKAGAAGIALDLALLGDAADDPIGTLVEAGTLLLLGVVPGTDAPLDPAAAMAGRIRDRWARIGFGTERVTASVSVSPACGLASASPSYARSVFARLRETARMLRDV